MEDRDIVNLLKRINIVVICVALFSLPLIFLTTTTDPFALPKQVVLVTISIFLLLVWAVASIFQRKIILRTNPFNLPLGIFTLVVLISSILSRNMYDSLSQSIPIVGAFILFFIIVNTITDKKEFTAVLTSLVLGASVSTIISILYYFKIYFLPIPAVQNQYFTTLGSPIQLILYVLPLFVVCLFMVLKNFKERRLGSNYEGIFYLATGAVLLFGVGLVLYQVLTVAQKPSLLPYIYGFQVGTAAISQDSNRLLISLPFGSGYGTFLSDFTRFKLPEINTNQSIWNFPFTYSSSFALELLATTGVLGFLSYLFIVARVLRTRARVGVPIYLGIVAVLIVSFFLPFSLTSIVLLYVLLCIYASYLLLALDRRIDVIKVSLVALRSGLFSVEETEENARRSRADSRALPLVVAAVVLLVGGYATFLSVKLLMADMKVARSLSQDSRSNGQVIYDLQRSALIDYPYRSDYYRIFSQVNLALANSISQNVPQGSSPSAQIQQTVSQLLQQSVGNARTAVAIAPVTAVNWANLGQIYRSLIGAGQNADQFAIASFNQAVLLDPSNPLLRLELGGIYYQLGNYDASQNQFQVSINLKPDFANAYYNLGHALEQKGDLKQALSAYQATLSLVKNNKDEKKKLEKEIDANSKKIGQTAKSQERAVSGSAQNQPPLGLTAPTGVAPTSTQRVLISPPPTPIQSGSTPTPTP